MHYTSLESKVFFQDSIIGLYQIRFFGQAQWLTSIILATWEAEIGRTVIQGQPGQKVHEASSEPIKAGHSGACLSSQLEKHNLGKSWSRLAQT
jgi:hypothetical protein